MNPVKTLETKNWCQLLSCMDYFRLGNWIFRGQADSNWKLTSKYDRAVKKDKIKLDGEDYKLILSRCKLNSYIEALAVLQHYGLPTKLLDFTYSFSVALRFAFDGEKKMDSCIWCLNLDLILGKLREIFEIEELSRVKTNAKWKEIDLLEKNIQDELFIYEYCNSKANLYLDNNKSISNLILPIVLQFNNDRISAQSGLFLFSTMKRKNMQNSISEFLDIDFSINEKIKIKHSRFLSELRKTPIIKIIIKRENFPSGICRMVQLLNVNYDHIFPDMDGMIKDIQERHRYKN